MNIKYILLALVLASSIVNAAEHKKVGTNHKVVAKHKTKKVVKPTKLAQKQEQVVKTEVVEEPVIEVVEQPKQHTWFDIGYSDTGVKPYTDKDVQCLAKNIYYEAGGEIRKGKVAVAQVTLNRVNSGKFADSICGVVYEKNQFSWVKLISRKSTIPFTPRWEECLEVAKAVLEGEEHIPAMANALYFHNTTVKVAFGKPLGKIGNHIFYGDRYGRPKRNENI